MQQRRESSVFWKQSIHLWQTDTMPSFKLTSGWRSSSIIFKRSAARMIPITNSLMLYPRWTRQQPHLLLNKLAIRLDLPIFRFICFTLFPLSCKQYVILLILGTKTENLIVDKSYVHIKLYFIDICRWVWPLL